MHATYSNSAGSRLGNTIIYESEAQRLQREADSFTKKFEHEKKGVLLLNDQLRNAEMELTMKQTNFKARIVSPRTMKQYQ